MHLTRTLPTTSKSVLCARSPVCRGERFGLLRNEVKGLTPSQGVERGVIISSLGYVATLEQQRRLIGRSAAEWDERSSRPSPELRTAILAAWDDGVPSSVKASPLELERDARNNRSRMAYRYSCMEGLPKGARVATPVRDRQVAALERSIGKCETILESNLEEMLVTLTGSNNLETMGATVLAREMLPAVLAMRKDGAM